MAFDILIKQNATVDDTLRLIVDAVNVCKDSLFVKKVVEELGPVTSKESFTKKLFDYLCRNGKYKLDIPGIEEVWTPALVIREGTFDCKKVSVFIASVLAAAGIDSVLKHVYYSNPDGSLKDYTHIYVVVPNPDLNNYITVDPTNDCRYNAEVDSSNQTLYFLNGKKMELHMMGRTPGADKGVTMPSFAPNTNSFSSVLNNAACDLESQMQAVCNSQTISGKNDYFSFTTQENIGHIAKVPVLAAPRNAFLGLLYLGKLLANTPLKINLASRLALAWNKNPNAVRKMWWKLGGAADASAIRTALIKTVGGTIKGPDQSYDYDRPWIITDINQGHYGMNGTMGQGPETLAALAAALPIIVVVKKFLTDNGILKPGETDIPVPPSIPPVPDNGTPVPDPKHPDPNAGSFATHSIDNVHDLLNFLKGAGVMLLGASLNPQTLFVTNIIVVASFIYAIRKKIFA